MVLQYKKSESHERPAELDTTSSKESVYIRKNIQEKTRTDEMTETSYTYCEYDEAVLTKTEYLLYQESQENQLAIAELAEALLGD